MQVVLEAAVQVVKQLVVQQAQLTLVVVAVAVEDQAQAVQVVLVPLAKALEL